jgi:hypothetical protein
LWAGGGQLADLHHILRFTDGAVPSCFHAALSFEILSHSDDALAVHNRSKTSTMMPETPGSEVVFGA